MLEARLATRKTIGEDQLKRHLETRIQTKGV
jgi:hypothetical protein